MTDNWQLEDKINEVIVNHNQLLWAVHTLLETIEKNQRRRGQGYIDTVPVRVRLNGIRIIDPLDLSPRDTEPYEPKLILTKRASSKKELE